MRISACPHTSVVRTNLVYLNPADLAAGKVVRLGSYAWLTAPSDMVPRGSVALSYPQRKCAAVGLGDVVDLLPAKVAAALDSMVISVSSSFSGRSHSVSNPAALADFIRGAYAGHPMSDGQQFVAPWNGKVLIITVQSCSHDFGSVAPSTTITLLNNPTPAAFVAARRA